MPHSGSTPVYFVKRIHAKRASEEPTLFVRQALSYEGVADTVGLAEELKEPPVMDDSVGHGRLPFDRSRTLTPLLNSRFVAITTGCLS